MDEHSEINYIRIIGIIIIVGILIYLVMPWNIIFPKKIEPVVDKTVYVNVTHTIYVTVTPTPDEGFYYANEYTNGTRKLNRPFTWERKDVSGLKDMKISVVVYDYRIMDKYNWFNIHDYKYYEQFPDNFDNKFLFVFINIQMDDISADDVRMWLPQRNLFAVQYNNKIYGQVDYPLDLRIKELENTNDMNDVVKVKAYGQFVQQYISGANAGKQESTTTDYLRGGKSNSEDGYIIYEIPKEAELKDLLVIGNFYSFGSAQWRLV